MEGCSKPACLKVVGGGASTKKTDRSFGRNFGEENLSFHSILIWVRNGCEDRKGEREGGRDGFHSGVGTF